MSTSAKPEDLLCLFEYVKLKVTLYKEEDCLSFNPNKRWEDEEEEIP
jgi:hypothetical protein